MPGLALPDSALATAMLPSIPDMVHTSVRNSRIAQKVSRPAASRPEQEQTRVAGARVAGCMNSISLMELFCNQGVPFGCDIVIPDTCDTDCSPADFLFA